MYGSNILGQIYMLIKYVVKYIATLFRPQFSTAQAHSSRYSTFPPLRRAAITPGYVRAFIRTGIFIGARQLLLC